MYVGNQTNDRVVTSIFFLIRHSSYSFTISADKRIPKAYCITFQEENAFIKGTIWVPMLSHSHCSVKFHQLVVNF